MKRIYVLLALMCLFHVTSAQIRMALMGGIHGASVKEENTLPGWESRIKPGYSGRTGLNLGILTEVPLSSDNRWFLSPAIFYMSKGRKFYMRNDRLTSVQTDTVSSAHQLTTNYIDIPFNLTYKLPLGKKTKLWLSAGPYVGLFYNGKQSFETRIYSSNSYNDEEVKLETGEEAGKMKTLNAGWNARAGFEFGNVLLSGFMSEGLTSFYTAPYEGSFKHQVRGVSIGFWLNKAAPIAKQVKAPKDSDKDGVPDLSDECPQVPGPAITGGCPDRADVPGKLKYNGCPVPDSDHDGLNDEADACPNQAGPVEFNGCPVPDMDGDGLNDREDKCPQEAGTKENSGCPEIKPEVKEQVAYAAKNIFFRAGSNVLEESSHEALDEIVKLLQANASFKLRIEGHTDSTGSAALNITLSQSRADAVKKYLTDKGVDAQRLQATGFGSSKPLTTNSTLEGRKRNRRVELILVQ